jgi:hypothetical protein
MRYSPKYFITTVYCLIFIVLAGCPGKNRKDKNTDENYHIGKWTGTVRVESRLTEKAAEAYWNGAWKIEANVSLDQFNDGSLKGTADCNYFGWDAYSPSVLKFEEITSSHYDKYAMLTININGKLDDKGYSLHVEELPKTIENTRTAGGVINFWDFLYPTDIAEKWPEDGSHVMKGESIRPQGNDLRATASLADFRKSDVKYTWSISRL